MSGAALTEAQLEARRLELEREFGEPMTVDGLSGAYRIFQRRRGHRHSTDDVLTAWYALQHAPTATRALDLGTGIGGVGLLVLGGMLARADAAASSPSLVAIEAQAISFRLLRENIRANGLGARVDARLGDLRDLALAERFALVTGSPPYFPPDAGIVPADSQKAHARFELRGDVADYCRVAAAHLAPGGWFVFCFPTVQRTRAEAAVYAAGLALVATRDVVPRAGRAPLFTLFACGPTHELGGAAVRRDPPFVVRTADGTHAPDLVAVRRDFGWPV